MTLGDEWDELPSAETGSGKGFIFLDNEGWTLPRPKHHIWFLKT